MASTPAVPRQAIERLLKPRSIAVVGASPEPLTIGNNVVRNIAEFGFDGDVHFVSRRWPEIEGRACHASIDELPADIDAIALVVPAHAVPAAIEACSRRRIGGAVVFAAGFAEATAEGRRQQDRLAKLACDAGIALLGPNCLGLVNFINRSPLTFELVSPQEAAEGVGIIAQSGAMAANLRMGLMARGTKVAVTVSTGNEAVVATENLLEALIDDPATNMVALFVEQIRNPSSFLALARRAHAMRKPIVLVHAGRSARAREAAISHTGALCGDYRIMAALVEEAGVLLLESLDEACDICTILTRYPDAGSGGITLMTNSGAVCGFVADFASQQGVELPPLEKATVQTLKAAVPSIAMPTNPLDMTGQAMTQPDLFGTCSRILLEDRSSGTLLVAGMAGSHEQQIAKWRSLRPAIEHSTKPTILCFLGDEWPLAAELTREIVASGIPFFRSLERAIRALAGIERYRRRPAPSADFAVSSTRSQQSQPGSPWNEYTAKTILREAGIPVPSGLLVQELSEARKAAAALGFPVVLKAQAAALVHKSDAGGVILGISDERALDTAWHRMVRTLAEACPDLVLDGILVEKMVAPGGLELIVCARRDAQWGPVLLAGLGGIWVELLDDLRIMPATFSKQRIVGELIELRGGPLFAGHRGHPPLDINAAADVLSQLGAMLMSSPNIAEIEINPLLVRSEGHGAIALDAAMIEGR